MTEVSRNFMVGLFVMASLVVLGTLMVWFGEVPDFLARNEWTLEITGVERLGGIGQGSPVYLNGVEVGRVRALDFRDRALPDRGVVIITRIKEKFTVPRGAIARVYGATFGLGSGHIDIVIERGASLEPLDKHAAMIPGEMRSIIGELISKEFLGSFERTVTHIGNLAEATKPVMEHLIGLIEERSVSEVGAPGAAEHGITANLSTVVERLDLLVANVNAVLGDESVQEDIRAAVRELKTSSEELRNTVQVWRSESQRLSDNLNGGIDRTEENLDRSFAELNQVLENMDDSMKSLASIADGVAKGQGTIGMLTRDPRLYEAAVLAMERLAEVVSDVKIITGKIKEEGYITVGQAPSGLLKKKFPVGPEVPEKNR